MTGKATFEVSDAGSETKVKDKARGESCLRKGWELDASGETVLMRYERLGRATDYHQCGNSSGNVLLTSGFGKTRILALKKLVRIFVLHYKVGIYYRFLFVSIHDSCQPRKECLGSEMSP